MRKSAIRTARLLGALLISVLWAQAAARAETRIVKDSGGRLRLVGLPCAELKKRVRDLREWTKKKGEKPIEPEPECIEKPEPAVMLNGSVPRFYESNHGAKPVCNGPNCWNSALVVSDIIPSHRYSTPEEMSFWMSSPLCSPVPAQEDPRPGDVIAIRKADNSEVHGFVYISSDLSYSKNGFNSQSPYLIQSTDNVFSVYSVPPPCRTHRPPPVPGCPLKGVYFRCEGVAAYAAKELDAAAQARIRQAEERVSGLEGLVSTCAMSSGTVLGPDSIAQIQSSLVASIQQLQKSTIAATDPSEKLLLTGAALRADATMRQLAIMQRAQAPSQGAGPRTPSR